MKYNIICEYLKIWKYYHKFIWITYKYVISLFFKFFKKKLNFNFLITSKYKMISKNIILINIKLYFFIQKKSSMAFISNEYYFYISLWLYNFFSFIKARIKLNIYKKMVDHSNTYKKYYFIFKNIPYLIINDSALCIILFFLLSI